MPNLRGARPVGCDRDDHLYTAWKISRGRPNLRHHSRCGVLGTTVMTLVQARRARRTRGRSGRARGRVGNRHEHVDRARGLARGGQEDEQAGHVGARRGQEGAQAGHAVARGAAGKARGSQSRKHAGRSLEGVQGGILVRGARAAARRACARAAFLTRGERMQQSVGYEAGS